MWRRTDLRTRARATARVFTESCWLLSDALAGTAKFGAFDESTRTALLFAARSHERKADFVGATAPPL